MTSTEPGSRKRRKKIHDASLASENIAGLPSEPLIHISSYLAAPSRALFAVALALDTETSQENISTAIVGYHWDTLDFGQIEKELAAKLSDEDISGVLHCIDAVNTVTKLRLTNCIKITGACLEPLRGSRVIKEIDLSLVGRHKSPLLDPRPPISSDIVLPILDDIIARCDVAIMIQFPKAWRQLRSNYFYDFLERYNIMWRDHLLEEAICTGCCNDIDHAWVVSWPVVLSGKDCGKVQFTCHGCLTHYCPTCVDAELNEEPSLKFCFGCERSYCLDCSKIDVCNRCDKYYCHDCTSFFKGCFGGGCEENIFCGHCQVKCDVCNQTSCKDCRVVRYSDDCGACLFDCTTCKRTLCVSCVRSPTCDMCDITICGDCNDKEGADGLAYCDDCDKELCIGCRYKDFKNNGCKCSECFGIICAAFDHVKGLHDNVSQILTKNK